VCSYKGGLNTASKGACISVRGSQKPRSYERGGPRGVFRDTILKNTSVGLKKEKGKKVWSKKRDVCKHKVKSSTGRGKFEGASWKVAYYVSEYRNGGGRDRNGGWRMK